MISKIFTSLLLLLQITSLCKGAPVFQSRKEASDWFKMMFASHVRMMDEDRLANEMTCEYGSYWSGEKCESCEIVCKNLKSTLCIKACPGENCFFCNLFNYKCFWINNGVYFTVWIKISIIWELFFFDKF